MQRYCASRYPPATKDSIIYRERVEYRDTLIKVYLPGETKIDTVFIDTTTNIASSILNTGFCNSSAIWSDGRLTHRLFQKDSIIDVLIKKAIKNAVIYEHSTRTITPAPVTTNIVTRWQNFQIYSFWVLAMYIVAGILWKQLLQGYLGKIKGIFKKKKPPDMN